MSEKHLTEQPWKALATKHGVKDVTLQKALVAYVKVDAAKAPKAALEAVKEISDCAVKVKKANAGKEEVVDYIDDILKEAKKITPVLADKAEAHETSLQAKEAETANVSTGAKASEVDDDEEEKEAVEFKKDLKKQMIGALAQVKLRAPDPTDKEPKPQMQFMALLAGEACAVIVARRVGNGTKKLLPDLIGGASGKFVSGECIFEKNLHTFVMEQVPGGLRAKIEKALQIETGTKYKARVRSFDGATVEDSEDTASILKAASAAPSPPAVAPPPSPAPPPPPAPDAAAGEMTKFTTRLKALQPDIVKASSTKTPEGEEVKRRAQEAGAFANKKDFSHAYQELDAVESLIKKALAASPAPAPAVTPAPPPPPQPAAAKPPPAPAPPPPKPSADTTTQKAPIKLSTYLTGRSNLRAARENAAKELERLQQAILAKSADEPFFKEVEAKSKKLFDYLAPIDDAVANQLDAAGRCTDPEEQDEMNKRVREVIQKQLASLRNHPLASFVQSNPFGKFIIRQPLEVTLSALEKQLS
jgi:hypothetical protein